MIKIYILNGKQCRSRSVGFFRSQLIWIYTVCNLAISGFSRTRVKTFKVKLLQIFSNKPGHSNSYTSAFAPSKDTDQPVHLHMLISLRCPREDALIPCYPLSALLRLWLDCANVQADLSFCSAHIQSCRKCFILQKKGLKFYVNHLPGRPYPWHTKPFFLLGKKRPSVAVETGTLRVILSMLKVKICWGQLIDIIRNFSLTFELQDLKNSYDILQYFFLTFPRKYGLIFHENCLFRNVKPYLLRK